MRALTALLLTACGSGATAPDAAVRDAPSPDATACPRTPRPAGPREVVVSHPYDAAGNPASVYQVLDLATDGTLTATTTTFTLGRSTIGDIAFTPDGAIGLVAQDDGSLGVFALDGTPRAIAATFTGSFYATKVVMDPSGAFAYVLDDQWRENGGGIYRVAIGCDGTPSDLGVWLPSKLPAGIALAGARMLVAAADVDGSQAGDDADAIDLATEARVAGVDAFGDDDAIVAGTALTHDGRYFLLGDDNQFGSVPNRIAVVDVQGDTLGAAQVISPADDPIDLVPSPFGGVVLALDGFGNAVHALDEHPGGSPPFTDRGVVASPQLPGGAVVCDDGLVLIAENLGVRRLQLDAQGGVTDLGLTALGSGNDAITGAIGVQP